MEIQPRRFVRLELLKIKMVPYRRISKEEIIRTLKYLLHNSSPLTIRVDVINWWKLYPYFMLNYSVFTSFILCFPFSPVLYPHNKLYCDCVDYIYMVYYIFVFLFVFVRWKVLRNHTYNFYYDGVSKIHD